jgi:excisionase family DNA binding protein
MSKRRNHDNHLPPVTLDRFGAAEYLGFGLTTLAELTAAGAIPSLRVGRRRLYRVADLDAWLAALVKGGDVA